MIRRLVAEQSGVALVLALLTMLVLAGLTTAVSLEVTVNHRNALHSTEQNQAFLLAEEGLSYAQGKLYTAQNPRDGASIPQTSMTVGSGTVTYSGSYNSATSIWTLSGTGSFPWSGGTLSRTVTKQVSVTTTIQGTQYTAVWNYLFADEIGNSGDSTCSWLDGAGVVVSVPIYTRGNFCAKGTAATGNTIQVGGYFYHDGSGAIGSAGTPVPTANITSGCKSGTPPGSGPPSGASSPCTSADKVYASTIGTAVTGLVKPPVDFATNYQNAEPGPKHACTSGSYPGGFDNDATQNGSLGKRSPISGAAYDCKVTDGQGNIIGRIAWTPGSGGNPGTFTVAGTIFIDGDLDMKDDQAIYQGKATIYVGGKVDFHGSAKLCGVAACDGTWDITQNLLIFVTQDSGDNSFHMHDSAILQAGIYAVGDFHEDGGGPDFWGTAVTDGFKINGGSDAHYVPFGTEIPGGAPGGGATTVTSLVNVPNSFNG